MFAIKTNKNTVFFWRLELAAQEFYTVEAKPIGSLDRSQRRRRSQLDVNGENGTGASSAVRNSTKAKLAPLPWSRFTGTRESWFQLAKTKTTHGTATHLANRWDSNGRSIPCKNCILQDLQALCHRRNPTRSPTPVSGQQCQATGSPGKVLTFTATATWQREKTKTHTYIYIYT